MFFLAAADFSSKTINCQARSRLDKQDACVMATSHKKFAREIQATLPHSEPRSEILEATDFRSKKTVESIRRVVVRV